MANMEDVKPPVQLSDRQIDIAKALVNNELNEKLTQLDFCKKHSLSSATLSKWNKDAIFSKYVMDLKGEVISQDEIQAYEIVKRHILARVNSNNPTEKDINLYLDNFQWVIKYMQQKEMEKLGINKNGKASNDARTLDEKRNVLLSRLKG